MLGAYYGGQGFPGQSGKAAQTTVVYGSATLVGGSSVDADAILAVFVSVLLQGGSNVDVNATTFIASGPIQVRGNSEMQPVIWQGLHLGAAHLIGDTYIEEVEAEVIPMTSGEVQFIGDTEITVDAFIERMSRARLKGGANLSILNPVVTHVPIPKRFYYKVYRNGEYVSNWSTTEVVSNPVIHQQINSGGSEVVVTLGRKADNFGEGYDVDFNNRVEIWVSDKQEPNGKRLFTGYISKYSPSFDDETVQITLLGYGTELNRFIIESGSTEDVEILASGENEVAVAGDLFIQGFVSGTPASKYGGVSFWGSVDQGFARIRATLYGSVTDAKAETAPLATGRITFNDTDLSEQRITFQPSVDFDATTAYAMRFEVEDTSATVLTLQASATSSYATYTLEKYNEGTTSWDDLDKDLQMSVWRTEGNTEVAYNSFDPSDILRSILDDYAARGGTLRYTEDSIDDTGTEVSYTFNTNTTLEGMNKVLELCPEGWYYYVDQANNVVHLHQRTTEPDHTFVLGKDITSLKMEKRAETIANIIHFTGGGEPPLYMKRVNQNSVENYGPRVVRIKDGRVTQEETAQLIINRAMIGSPEILVNVDIGDNSEEPVNGYDIESVQLGQVVRIANAGASASSRYDQAKYDESPYDYSLDNISSILFQLTDINYVSGDFLRISLSTTPPDVAKRITDIKRNVDDVNFADNPAVPETA